MLPFKRDKQIGFEHQNNQRYDADQAETKIKLECVPVEEQDHDIFADIDAAVLTNLKVSCSDNEDPYGASAGDGPVSQGRHIYKPTGRTVMASTVGLQNETSRNEFAVSEVMNMFRSVIELVKKVQGTTNDMRKEIEHISIRLGRVEKKVGISLATLETVKDGMIMDDGVSETENSNSPEPSLDFKRISNEEEFTEFDAKLGSDAEYYANVKKWLTKQIHETDPDNRMLVAMDLIMERTFFAECTWTGAGSPGRKIAFGIRTNVLRFFRDIGSSKVASLNEKIVTNFFRNKLNHAKRRAKIQGTRKSVCHKIRRT